LATLERSDDLLMGLAVVRNQKQGHISAQEQEHFALLAPHARAAVRTQLALEGQGTALLMGGMDALSIPVFVCDRQRQVRALTPPADALLTANRGLLLRQGRLRAANNADDKSIQDAVHAALQPPVADRGPRLRTVVIRHGADKRSLVLDVVTLPARQFDFHFAPRVLILTRGERGQDGRRAAILQAAYGLTGAEAEIAVHIAQ